jgi:vanillate O-demethylase ferredoxin subunit
VHLEYFSADPASLAGPKDSFIVRLARHGGEFEITEGRTIIEVLGENGVTVETSCEQGVCGTCLTGVIEGEPDHRDVFLTDAEKRANDRMTVCVSRAKSARLVLDL